MPTQLPPEDQPPSPGLVPADPAGALADAGPDSPHNPVMVGAAFYNAVLDPDGPRLADLQFLVTPESWPAWGDFTEVADLLDGCGMTTRADPAMDDDKVVYVKFVTDPGQTLRAQSEMIMMARAVATLAWRPELGGWRVHGIGEYMRPEDVPH